MFRRIPPSYDLHAAACLAFEGTDRSSAKLGEADSMRICRTPASGNAPAPRTADTYFYKKRITTATCSPSAQSWPFCPARLDCVPVCRY